MTTTTRPLTLDEFLRRPETKPYREYLDGKVERKTMPDGRHMFVQKMLSMLFGLFLREHPLGEGGPEWRFVFGPPGHEHARVPDLAFVVAARLYPGYLDGSYRGPPDLAVEVLSPGDRRGKVQAKIAFYLANGVRLVWLVDPRRRTVTVYQPEAPVRILTDADTLDGGAVLPGFVAPVRDILPPADR